jgi:hypothetical protein
MLIVLLMKPRIFVPASDFVDGNIGKGVNEILRTLRARKGENISLYSTYKQNRRDIQCP